MPRDELTLLAYEMNGSPLNMVHGAPLRLRCENELGFKMVRWIAAIEFVADFAELGVGQGGYNEDHEFYGYRMPFEEANGTIPTGKPSALCWVEMLVRRP